MSGRRKYYVGALLAGVAFAFVKIVPIFIFPTDTKDDTHRPKTSASPGANAVTLLAPERPVKPGENLTGVEFKELFWPKNHVPDGAVRDLIEIKGMFAKVALSPQLPIQRIHLTRDSSDFILPVSPGLRAVTISVPETPANMTNSRPGSVVDVTLSYQDRGSAKTRVVVRKALILARGSNARRRDGTHSQNSLLSVTLDLTTDAMAEIEKSISLGTINLVVPR